MGHSNAQKRSKRYKRVKEPFRLDDWSEMAVVHEYGAHRLTPWSGDAPHLLGYINLLDTQQQCAPNRNLLK